MRAYLHDLGVYLTAISCVFLLAAVIGAAFGNTDLFLSGTGLGFGLATVGLLALIFGRGRDQ